MRASFASAKAYFDGEKEAGRDREESREAVRWFFRAAKRRETEGDVGKEESGGGERGGTLNAERSTLNSQEERGEGTPNAERRTQKCETRAARLCHGAAGS